MRARAAVAAAVAVASLLAPGAVAHEEHALHALTVINSVSPEVDGLEVRVVHLESPALFVRNGTAQTLTVFGESGEPFLQITPRAVRANAESPTTYRSSAPGAETVPANVHPERSARWVTLANRPMWTWFDPRLRIAPGQSSWEVHMSLGSDVVIVEGGFESLQGHGHFVSELQAPDVPGLELRLIQGQIPALFVRNETGKWLSVPGISGEPFLRIGPRGVYANLRSPTYYTSGATSIRKVPPSANGEAPPEWSRLSDQPVWAWLERRAAVPHGLQQRAQLGSQRHAVLEWMASYRLGEEIVEVGGRVEWVPPLSAARDESVRNNQPLWALVAGLGLAGVAVAVVAARRRLKVAA